MLGSQNQVCLETQDIRQLSRSSYRHVSPFPVSDHQLVFGVIGGIIFLAIVECRPKFLLWKKKRNMKVIFISSVILSKLQYFILLVHFHANIGKKRLSLFRLVLYSSTHCIWGWCRAVIMFLFLFFFLICVNFDIIRLHNDAMRPGGRVISVGHGRP